MWWNVKNGLAKRASGSVSLKHPTPSTSPEIDRMMREINADLTTMIQQEQEIVKADVARKAREHCMKDISHDLRTPLNAIIGFAQMMENGALGRIENPQYIEYLRHIRESGYELLTQVEDLLNADIAPSAERSQMRSKQLHKKYEEAVA